jgi:hypothetical protein
MIQEQAAQSKQPGEEEQKLSDVEMQLAIPKLEHRPKRNEVPRFNSAG